MVEVEVLEAPKVKPLYHYGQRFAEARKLAAASQGAVAAASGVSTQAISQFERGQQSLSLEVFAAACHLLGLRTDWVLYGSGEMYSGKLVRFSRRGGGPARKA